MPLWLMCGLNVIYVFISSTPQRDLACCMCPYISVSRLLILLLCNFSYTFNT
jgi:hypothetical protein